MLPSPVRTLGSGMVCPPASAPPPSCHGHTPRRHDEGHQTSEQPSAGSNGQSAWAAKHGGQGPDVVRIGMIFLELAQPLHNKYGANGRNLYQHW